MLREEWLPIAGFEGAYEVSNLGRVRSLKKRPLFLNPMLPANQRRYMAVSLHLGGRRIRRSVHTLVTLAFHGPRPSPEHEARHLDGDRSNNSAANLAWGTRKDNAADRKAHGKTASGHRHGMFGRGQHGSSNGYAKLTEEQATEIRALSGTMSQRAIAHRFGVSQGTVWRIIGGKSWVALRARASERGKR